MLENLASIKSKVPVGPLVRILYTLVHPHRVITRLIASDRNEYTRILNFYEEEFIGRGSWEVVKNLAEKCMYEDLKVKLYEMFYEH